MVGNSGAKISLGIVKSHDDARAEGNFCIELGQQVAPRVYYVSQRYEKGPEYYVMEFLDPAPRTPDLLIRIEALLASRVWHRSGVYHSESWQRNLENRYGVRTPPFVLDSLTQRNMMHGDCTVANAMQHPGTDDLVLADPVWYRNFIPSHRAADWGKMMQSVAGWETVASGEPRVEYCPPVFAMDEESLRLAAFWCAVNMKRIQYREVRIEHPRDNVMSWTRDVLLACSEITGVLL